MGHGLYGDMVSAARYFDQAVPLFRSLAERRGLASSLISRAVWRSPLFTDREPWNSVSRASGRGFTSAVPLRLALNWAGR